MHSIYLMCMGSHSWHLTPGVLAEKQDAQDQLEKHFQELIRPGVGHCDTVKQDNATGLHSLSCYSPPITLRPGQVSP